MDLLAFERITADQFAEVVSLVRSRPPVRAHFIKNDRCTCLGRLVGSLAAGQSSPDHMNCLQILF